MYVLHHYFDMFDNVCNSETKTSQINEGAIAGPGQLSYSFEHLNMEKPKAWKTMDGVRLSSMLFTRLKDISTPHFSTPSFNPVTLNPKLFNHHS